MRSQGVAIMLATLFTKTIFSPEVLEGGTADSILGLVQLNLTQGIAGLAICYWVQVSAHPTSHSTAHSNPKQTTFHQNVLTKLTKPHAKPLPRCNSRVSTPICWMRVARGRHTAMKKL